jgi:hypothetical protein
MKIETERAEKTFTMTCWINGKPYSRHYNFEAAEVMRDKLVAEQEWLIAAAHDIFPRHLGRHLRRIYCRSGCSTLRRGKATASVSKKYR